MVHVMDLGELQELLLGGCLGLLGAGFGDVEDFLESFLGDGGL